MELREPRLVDGARNAFAHGEEHDHRLQLEPARDEAEHLRRRPVEPLRVLDEEEQRPLGLGFRQQPEGRQSDQERIRGVAVGEADRRLEGAALRFGQAVARLEKRKQQLVQPGEGESRLGRHARRGDHRHVPLACSHRGSLEQRGLPDPGLAAHDERAAALPDPIDQAVELSQLVVSAEKLGDSRVGAGASQVDLASSAGNATDGSGSAVSERAAGVQSNDSSDAAPGLGPTVAV